MLSSSEIAQMAAAQEALMTSVAEIVGFVETSDGAGGVTRTEVKTLTKCRVFPRRSGQGELLTAGMLAQGMVWELVFPLNTVVAGTNQVVVDSTRRFEVIAVLGPHSQETARIVYALER